MEGDTRWFQTAVLQLTVDNAKTRCKSSVPVRVRCALILVTKGGSTEVTLGLASDMFWIIMAKSTVGEYDHVLLCNGV